LNPDLEASHNILLTVLDSLDAIVYVADLETYELLFLNKYARNIFGDGAGKPCWQVLQSDQAAPCDFCSNDKLVAPDGTLKGLYTWEFQNTVSRRWYDIRDRAITWIDGRIVRLEIATDITDRKLAEEKLFQEKQFTERIIASSVEGILAFDLECRYTLWNQGMESISGVAESHVLGKNAFEVFPFLKETGEDRFFLDALAGKSVISKDRPYHVPATGQQGFFEGIYSPLRNESGEVVGGLAIIRDTTERKRAEEERENLIAQLQEALNEIKTLKGILPVCSYCMKIRDDQGNWNKIEAYIQRRSEAKFSHGICPDCAAERFPDDDIYPDS